MTLAAWVALSGHVRPSQRLGGVAACLVVARRGSCAKAVCCVSRALAVELSAAALFSTDGTSEVPSVAPGSSTALGGASGQGDSVAALHAILVALGACAGSCMPHLSLAVGTLVAAHAVGHISRTKRLGGRHAADSLRRRWDCGGGKVMTVCTDTRSKVKGTVHSTPHHTLRSRVPIASPVAHRNNPHSYGTADR